MTRKPILTLTPSDVAICEVRLPGWPFYFSAFQKGYSQRWLQYNFKTGDLSMAHRTSYTASMDWDGQPCHEIRVEYYEPEFPDAKVILFLLIKEDTESYEVIRWTQYYPGYTANSMPVKGDRSPKIIRKGDKWTVECLYGDNASCSTYEVGPTFVLDSCGQKQIRCVQLIQRTDSSRVEIYFDDEGSCVLARFFRKLNAEDGNLECSEGDGNISRSTFDGDEYEAVWDEVPDRLVFAGHW